MSLSVSGSVKEKRWIKIQHKAFARWINIQFSNSIDSTVRQLKVNDLSKDLSDGVKLNYLIKELSSGNYSTTFNEKPKFRIHYVDNISCVLEYLRSSNFHLHSLGAEDIYEGNLKMILGLIWGLILNSLSELEIAKDFKAIKAIILRWCQLQVKQFDKMVKIVDFSESWNNGVALCALLASVRPDLIDFYTLDLTKKEHNIKKALDLATNEMGIPQLVDSEDLLVNKPDEKAVLTYVLGWYEMFGSKEEFVSAPKTSEIKIIGKNNVKLIKTKSKKDINKSETAIKIATKKEIKSEDQSTTTKKEQKLEVQLTTPKEDYPAQFNFTTPKNQIIKEDIPKRNNSIKVPSKISNPFNMKSLSDKKSTPLISFKTSRKIVEAKELNKSKDSFSTLNEPTDNFFSNEEEDFSRASSISRSSSVSETKDEKDENWLDSLDSKLNYFENQIIQKHSSKKPQAEPLTIYDDSLKVPERHIKRSVSKPLLINNDDNNMFRNTMISLSQILLLKEEFEKKSKIFNSNIRTQIYKWTNLSSYNELYDLEELEFEKKFLQENFQVTKKKLLMEKNSLNLLFNKINYLMKNNDNELNYTAPIGLGLNEIENIWLTLAEEESKYLKMIMIKSDTLKKQIKNNYLDTLRVINNKFNKLKVEINFTNQSLYEEKHVLKIIEKFDSLFNLLKNFKTLHNQCELHNIDYNQEFLNLKLSSIIIDDHEFINPFDPINDEINNKVKNVELLNYTELLFEIEVLQNTIKELSFFIKETNKTNQLNLDELSNILQKTSETSKYITKKEIRSLLCSSNFDKFASKNIEKSLPIHKSFKGYDYQEFINQFSSFKIKLQPAAIIKTEVSASNSSATSSICDDSPRISEISTPFTNDSPFNSPATFFTETSSPIVNNKFENRRKVSNKFSKHPTKLQLPIDFTIVLEEQYHI